MTAPHILVADDQQDILETLHLTLKSEGWRCTSVRNPKAVLEALAKSEFDLLLMDLNYQRDTTSGQEGLELLESIQAMENAPPVVVMTAWGSVELAVEALQRGARDFIEKPWDNLRLKNVMRAQIDLSSSQKQSARLSANNAMLSGEQREFVVESRLMKDLFETLKHVATSDASVLISGENGTGKNQLAFLLHRFSNRHDQAMVTMDVGAITETLFESELFGHTRGAFTDARETKLADWNSQMEEVCFWMRLLTSVPLNRVVCCEFLKLVIMRGLARHKRAGWISASYLPQTRISTCS